MISVRAKLFALNVLSALKRQVVGKNATAILFKSRNGLLLVDVEDSTLGRSLASIGEYGWDEVERLRSCIGQSDDVLIVGAHVGSIAIPIAKYCREVVAVEANPRTTTLLRLNLLINGVTNVEVVNIAASDKTDEIPFLLSRVNSGGSKRRPLVRDAIYYSDSPETINVLAKPLDEVLPNLNPAAILMDIEGSEFFAARGMQRLLAQTGVLFMEFLPHHLKNVSGVSVRELLQLLAPHFTVLFVPSKNLTVTHNEFLTVLQSMFDAGEGDDGIVFAKEGKFPTGGSDPLASLK